MNLSEMLREKNPVLTRQTAPDCIELTSLGEELAALVEAADAMVSPDATNPRHVAYANARAALVAKIGGKG